jgi:transcriptional regulator with XRE-family HTH domain
MTLEALADAADINVTYVSDIEHGKSSPTVGKLGDLARALGMRLSALIAEAEDRAEQ